MSCPRVSGEWLFEFVCGDQESRDVHPTKSPTEPPSLPSLREDLQGCCSGGSLVQLSPKTFSETQATLGNFFLASRFRQELYENKSIAPHRKDVPYHHNIEENTPTRNGTLRDG